MIEEFCPPINVFLMKNTPKGCTLLDYTLSDYHFKEYHIRVKGNLDAITFDENQFERQGNKLICKCHWSVLEFLEE
jgi:hypothetical protein